MLSWVEWGVFFGVSWAIYQGLLRFLKSRRLYQPIFSLSPEGHQKKQKTPSFGGVGILASLSIGSFFLVPKTPEALWLMGVAMGFGLIGFLDDFLSVRSQKNKGLSASQKSLAQIFTGIVLLFFCPLESNSWLVFALNGIVFLGASNATNLTDGLDGLLAGLAMLTLTGFGVVFLVQNQVPEALFCGVFLISTVGFFLINRHPAKIFMGDTGSLAFGAVFTGLGILSGHIFWLIPFGLVYILETLSVIVQVASYKIRKERIFLMAPLHHHFELLGLSEVSVVWLFWGLGFIGVVIGLLGLLGRVL